MSYDPAVLRRATARLEGERRAREERQQALRRAACQRQPRLSEIDRQLRGTMTELFAASLRRGEGGAPTVEEVRRKNLALQQERAELLARMDLAEDALDDKPACPLCGDTGWRGTEMCRCLRALCAQEQIRELSKLLDLGEQSFDTFRMDYYSTSFWPEWGTSPRENMELVYEVCLNYAQKFGRFYFKNLFLSGAPGLGKTFLSACIARTVSENGHSVVYDTAGNVFAQFEARKFLRDSDDGREARDETRRYLGCDLLILDDLGSELTTQFTQSALYELINGRLVGESAPSSPLTCLWRRLLSATPPRSPPGWRGSTTCSTSLGRTSGSCGRNSFREKDRPGRERAWAVRVSSAFFLKDGAAAAAGDGDLSLALGYPELLTAAGAAEIAVLLVPVHGAAEVEPVDGRSGQLHKLGVLRPPAGEIAGQH